MKRPYLVVHPSWIPFIVQFVPYTFGYLILYQHAKQLDSYISAGGLRRRIILDNGAWEGDKVPTGEELLETAVRVGATYVVAPDRIGEDAHTNFALADEFLHLWVTNEDFKNNVRPLVMLQGKNSEDILNFWTSVRLSVVNAKHGIAVGLPRHLADRGESRDALIDALQLRAPGGSIRFHLMGMSKNPSDDIRAYRRQGVTGIDSAKPLWMPPITFDSYLKGEEIQVRRPDNFFQEDVWNLPLEVLTNFRYYTTVFRIHEEKF